VEVLEERCVAAVMVTDLTTTTPAFLAQVIAGNNVPISNVQYSGGNSAGGFFTGGQQAFGFDSGIVLSTGLAGSIAGPNLNTNLSTINNTTGNPALSNIIGGTPTFEAAQLYFDFVATGNTLSFQFVFGSDEFSPGNGQAGTGFNDVFAAFLNGQNIALLPGTRAPIDINTLSQPGNAQFLINNPEGNDVLDTDLNAVTVVLPVTVPVTPGKTYHMEFAIADASNAMFDSDVMIKANSFTTTQVGTYRPLRYTYDATTGLYSGDITLTNPSNQDLPGATLIQLFNLPPGVTVANAVATTSSGLPLVAVPNGTIPANGSVDVPILLRNPLNKPLGSYFIGYTIEPISILT
jgi:hypothetical protein